jgi:hypothetical protein
MAASRRFKYPLRGCREDKQDIQRSSTTTFPTGLAERRFSDLIQGQNPPGQVEACIDEVKVFYGAGLNENQYPHPSEAASGSYNFDLKKGLIVSFPRVPFDVLATATNGGRCSGASPANQEGRFRDNPSPGGNTVYKWDGGYNLYQQGDAGNCCLAVQRYLLVFR